MKADVRIIRLTRKIIRDQNNIQALNETEQNKVEKSVQKTYMIIFKNICFFGIKRASL